MTGSLAVTIGGLPASAQASVVISGPGGFARALGGSSTLTDLVPGTYTIAAGTVHTSGAEYAAVPDVQSIHVSAGSTPAIAVQYHVATGALAIVVTGLPPGAPAAIDVTGPDGFSASLAQTATLTHLIPGSYTVRASMVHDGGNGYLAAPASLVVDVAAAESAATVPVTYTIATGSLAVTIQGLPPGTSPVVSVAGPNGYSATLSASAVIGNLAPGLYTVSGQDFTVGADLYALPVPLSVTVAASLTPAQATAAYVLVTGRLTVAIGGLPDGIDAAVHVSGPGAYAAQLTSSATLVGLSPGSYSIAAAAVATSNATYNPAPALQSSDVQPSATPVLATVTYALATGALSLFVDGLPEGVSGDVIVSGPGGYHSTVGGNITLWNLTPGQYTIAAANVTQGSDVYAPQAESQNVTILASATPAAAFVHYAVVPGTLAITVSGLPNGVAAAIQVTGPGGYSAAATASQSLAGLAPGTYTIAATGTASGGTSYAASPASQNASVTSGGIASAIVTYSAIPTGPNLVIDGLYVTQVVQTYTGTVPLVAGRDGLLRVFVRATEANSVQPAVRVRFYSGGVQVSTVQISAPVPAVPTTITEGTLNSSWNAVVPAALLQPGMSILADVDPGNAISEPDESDNAWPVSGTPASLDVRTVSTQYMRLVPITQSANGFTGGVTAGNQNTYLATLRQIYPLSSVDADLRAAYTTSAPVLQSNDGNGAWTQILSELNALRTADGSTRYYYGVVHTTYSSGVAGLGYVPGRAAIGWDILPSGSGVLAHEVGHNFGRWHAPCGGPSQVDPAYPYAGGVTGVYGYDAIAGVLKPPSRPDLMGYCSNPWISDYNYVGVLDYRSAHPITISAAVGGTRVPSLLIWGRIHDGQLVLEPAYEIDAPARLPAAAGPNVIEGFDAQGSRLFSFSFDGEHVADAADPRDQTFAFAIPRTVLGGRSLARLRLAALGQSAELRAAGASSEPVIRTVSGAPVAVRTPSGDMRITWSEASIRGILVRDVRSGEILSFARGGEAVVRSRANEIDVVVSDGVRNEHRRLTPR